MSYEKPEDNPVAMQLLFIANRSINLFEGLEENNTLSKNGTIEVLIFNAVFVKKYIKEINAKIYWRIELDFDVLLYKYLRELGINNLVPNAASFIKSRRDFYAKEIEEMQIIPGWLPSNIFNIFYETPLSTEITPNFDLSKIMSFQIVLNSLTELLKNLTEEVIKNNSHL